MGRDDPPPGLWASTRSSYSISDWMKPIICLSVQHYCMCWLNDDFTHHRFVRAYQILSRMQAAGRTVSTSFYSTPSIIQVIIPLYLFSSRNFFPLF